MPITTNFLICLLFIDFSVSFAPNRLFSTLASLKITDQTHATITEEGIDEYVKIYYNGKVKRFGKQRIFSTLKSMAKSTVRKLTGSSSNLENAMTLVYGRNCVIKLSPYHKAVEEIVRANGKTDSGEFGFRADFHFDAEKFHQSNANIMNMLKMMTKYTKKKLYGKARESLGHALHTTQDFYAHSNWVELGNTKNPSGGVGNENGFEYKIASVRTSTCKDCNYMKAQCKNNIIVKNVLTSGYAENSLRPTNAKDEKGEDVIKPRTGGKCSHGGLIDKSSSIPAKGGINKDTTSPLTSPHYYLHHTAANVAKMATVQLMEQIRRTIGDKEFQMMLQLNQPSCTLSHQRAFSFTGLGPKSSDQVWFYKSHSSSPIETSNRMVQILSLSNFDFSQSDLIIPIDNTLEEFRINISPSSNGESSRKQATISLTSPSAVQKSFDIDFTEIDLFVNILAKMPEPGNWKIRMSGGDLFSINVQAVSPWDAVIKVMKYEDYNIHNSELQPVDIDPQEKLSIGSTLYAQISTPIKYANLTKIELETTDGRKIDNDPSQIESRIERDLSRIVVQFTVPEEKFRFVIRGKDESGFDLVRKSENVYVPEKRDEL